MKTLLLILTVFPKIARNGDIMKIFVDGIVAVVDIAIKIAKEYNLEIIIVKNYNHEIWRTMRPS